MGKYLKMADEFSLPVKEDTLEVYCRQHIGESFRSCEVYSAHAINSHDELMAEVERLRDMVVRMQTYLDMAGEYPEKESDNPVRQWLFDAIDCTK